MEFFLFSLFGCIFSAQAQNTTKDAEISKVSAIELDEKGKITVKQSSASAEKISFKYFTLQNPERLVVDILNSNLAKNFSQKITDSQSKFRYKEEKGAAKNSVRLVFEFQEKIKVLSANSTKNGNSFKLEITISKTASSQATSSKTSTTKSAADKNSKTEDFILNKVAEFETEVEIPNQDQKNSKNLAETENKKNPKNKNSKGGINAQITNNSAPTILGKISRSDKIPVIVIDSGHGGKDPGTIGVFARTKEKNLALSYARELAKQLNNSKRYKVYLTRDEDFFIPLKKRVAIARKKKADLFISLHANSAGDSDVHGFSIYTLSEKSSDKQAELLAQKENRADIISGINFSGATPDIMKTLIDLSQRDAMNGSSIFANMVMNSMRDLGVKNLQNTHRYAGFAVLTAPDMISVLIELGYLTNRKEEKLLNSLTYKRKIALGITMAIDEYFAKNKS